MNDDNRFTVAIIGVVSVVVAVFAAIVSLTISQPDRDHTNEVTLLLGLAATVSTTLLALAKLATTSREVREQKQTSDATAQTVSELANGSMDAKIRLAVAQVLAPHAVDPGALDQLAQDRLRVRELDDLAADLKKRVSE